ncbi:hypothetical protein BaRGS_00020161 [Batillaria attramentaria]|uniref:Uncharacterized protein n=1 Tax=Batillaria attramentaria TaxID=370345 RepID=A0ABD0KNA6_9CAEN
MAACTPRANAGGNEENLDAITSQLKNEQFEILTSRVGQKRSKGRPSHKDKINVAVTNQLLLQLHLIRQETGCQLSALQALFGLGQRSLQICV